MAACAQRLGNGYARAREAIEWAQITQQDFTSLLERQPILALRLLRELIARYRGNLSATIQDLKAKNQALAQAYYDLQQAQSALIEKEKLEHELEIECIAPGSSVNIDNLTLKNKKEVGYPDIDYDCSRNDEVKQKLI